MIMIMIMIRQVAGPLVVCIGLLMLAIGIFLSAVNSSRRWSYDSDDDENYIHMMLMMMKMTKIIAISMETNFPLFASNHSYMTPKHHHR